LLAKPLELDYVFFDERVQVILAVHCSTLTGRVWNADLYPIISAAGSGVDGVVIHPYLHLDDDSKGGGVLQPGLPPRVKGEGLYRPPSIKS
jgi:hypothetical protein